MTPFFQLLSIAYSSTVRRRVLLFFALSVLLEVGSVTILFFLNRVYGQLYQGVQDYDIPVIWWSIGRFALFAGILVGISGFLSYFSNLLAFELRTGLTAHFISPHLFLSMEQFPQRVQEDFRKWGDLSVELFLVIFKSLLKLVVFSGVIISLTQWWIGAALIVLVVAGTLWTKRAAKPLVLLQSVQESNEAAFRSTLDPREYLSIKEQFHRINRAIKTLTFIQSGLGQGFALLPFILLMPLYVSKQLLLGPFFQSVNALSRVVDSLSVLIDNRQLIAQFGTVCVRLQPFLQQGGLPDRTRGGVSGANEQDTRSNER